MIKENSLIIFDWVKEHDGEDFIATDIADATGIGVKTVNGSVTAFCKKGVMERIPAEIETEDENGSTIHKQVKLIRLTPEGKYFDPRAVVEAE